MNQQDFHAPPHPRRYASLAGEYLSNAYLSLQRDELEKASEFLWGSLAQAIKAVAALKELRLRSHREIWNYLVELSREWA